ncbi:MAG: DegQ family serine endoprotease [Gammaproteobacteria bacterium]
MTPLALSHRSRFTKDQLLVSIFGLLLVLSTRSLATVTQMPDFEDLVEKQSPAVVNIQTRRKSSAESPGARPRVPEFLRHFHNFQGQRRPSPRSAPLGMGSGVIASTDGYILTNAHVVDGATEITVHLNDQRELPATVVGADRHTDIAILKIEAIDLPAATFGNSDRLRVGQWVLAIGAPFGLEQTATQGIVSAVSRSLPNDNYVPFIQTDVALNPGNSGGPLFNLNGEVIGINSQIFSRTGGYMGLSFAVPINLAASIAEKLKQGESIARGWLGISIQDLDQALAKSFGLAAPKGALISSITPNSPAAQAKFQPGDVIVEFDGHPIERSAALPPIVAATTVNSDTVVKVFRSGKPYTIKVKVGLLETDQLTANEPVAGPLGVIVSDLTRENRASIGVENGVRVDQIEPGKPAAVAGLQPRDIIVSFNHSPIDNVAELIKISRQAKPGSTVPVLVQRQRKIQFIALKVPANKAG